MAIPLIPLAATLFSGAAAAAGIQHNKGEGQGGLLDPQRIAKGESYNFRDEELKDYGIVDQIRNSLYGDKERITEIVKKRDEDRLKMDNAPLLDRIKDAQEFIKNRNPDYIIAPAIERKRKESAKAFEERLATEAGKLERIQSALIQNPNLDTSTLGTNFTAGDVQIQAAKQARQEPWSPENQFIQLQKDKLKADKLQMLQLQNQTARNNQQFQIQMAQQDFNNRRLDLREARDEKKDRQAMIMMIVQGLQNVGKSFAV